MSLTFLLVAVVSFVVFQLAFLLVRLVYDDQFHGIQTVFLVPARLFSPGMVESVRSILKCFVYHQLRFAFPFEGMLIYCSFALFFSFSPAMILQGQFAS